ncbi:MAG: GDSL-type esterase/lipase family protein [Nitrospirae bacterium YQR-1]
MEIIPKVLAFCNKKIIKSIVIKKIMRGKYKKVFRDGFKGSDITILAFGDSLTVGFQSPTYERPWYEETPYADFLKEKMHFKADFIVSGVSGQLTSDMAERFESDVLDLQPNYVIILGGTNDLGWGVTISEIVENLTGMYQRSIANGITPVAVTVPSIRGFDSAIAPRVMLNSMIMQSSADMGFHCIDLFAATCEKDTLALASEYSNDGLHLSTEGYRVIADLLYDEVFRNINRQDD